MKRFALVPVVALLAACEGGLALPDLRGAGGGSDDIAPPPVLSAKERLVVAAEDNGCIIDINTIGPIMNSAAIGAEDLKVLVPELEAEGRVAPEGTDKVRVLTPNCIAAA